METCICPHEKHDCGIPLKTNFEMVKEFHRTFKQPIGSVPKLISNFRKELRISLMDEELFGERELEQSMDKGDLIGIADGIADLLYVVYGTAAEYGIDADAVFAEVHRSNMSKLGDDGRPLQRADGKILKGPNYQEPDIAAVLRKQGAQI